MIEELDIKTNECLSKCRYPWAQNGGVHLFCAFLTLILCGEAVI